MSATSKFNFLLGDTLKHLKSLKDVSVFAGVTSPPYNKQEKQKGWLVKNVEYDAVGDAMPELAYQNNQIEVLDELWRITKPGGHFFYNHKTRWDKGEMLHPMQWLTKTKWVVRQELIWDRIIAANIRGWRFWQVDERIYWLYKPIDDHKIGKEIESKHALLTSIWRFGPERKNPHPAPFPLQLPLRALMTVLEGRDNETVIDPYCGSGTTLLAANMLGHNAIGIDCSEAYLGWAKERVQTPTREELLVYEAEQELHKVTKSFAERKLDGGFVGKHRKTKFSDDLPLMTLAK